MPRQQNARSGYFHCGHSRIPRRCPYAPDLPDASNIFRIVNKTPKVRRNNFASVKPIFRYQSSLLGRSLAARTSPLSASISPINISEPATTSAPAFDRTAGMYFAAVALRFVGTVYAAGSQSLVRSSPTSVVIAECPATVDNETGLAGYCGTVELAGCAGFGPGAAGSIGGFGSVGNTVAPAARAASPVVE
jgi:hypothetical protein